MILADTSIWIEHFRKGRPDFAEALRQSRILTHPVVIGELATGNLSNREPTLAALQRLPSVKIVTERECLLFLEAHRLFGKGIDWCEVQLLAAARLSKVMFWTLDKRLADASKSLGVAFRTAN